MAQPKHRLLLRTSEQTSPNAGQTAVDAENKSTDPLPPQPALPLTSRLNQRGFTSIEELLGPLRLRATTTDPYVVVPAACAEIEPLPGTPTWRIELWADELGLPALRLETVGDVILGRSEAADVDLQRYGASEKGVSRRHAMLRPSRNALYLLDLGSTNGTQYNAIPVGQGIAVPLSVHGVIRLGKLILTVRSLSPVAPE
jgi:hypothetical protein